MKLVRRPIPLATKDIGTWWHIFSAIGVLSILSNTALFCFTSRAFSKWVSSANYEYLIFALIVVVLMIFRGQIQTWIPDVAEKYEIVKARHEFLLERILRGGVRADNPEEIETFDGTLYFSSKKTVKSTDLD